jgi:23S rRNA (uracil1939-C5)-methyltransferase
MNNNIKICPYSANCGGCQLQGVPYQEQIDEKMAIVEDVVGYYAPVAPIISMDDPTHYRNKSQSAYAMKKGVVINGKYRLYSHELTPVKSCMLEDNETDVIFQTVNELMNTLYIEPYDEELDLGVIRHVLVRKSFSTNQIMVVLVSGTKKIPHKKDFLKLLLTRHPNITTVILNINNKQTSKVLGDDEGDILYGDGYIEDVLCGLTFEITEKSFYHVNSIQTEKLYDIAIKMAQLQETDTVLDAYSSVGALGLIAAKQGIKHLISVERNESSIMEAKLNASNNHIEDVEFICADPSAHCKLRAKAKEKVDVIFLEPSKNGTDERFLAAAMKMEPRKIIYISCNVDTLDRDLRYIERFGDYKVRGIQPFDMFPYTEHLENIVLIEKE